mmetsp:Transcript_20441/g.66861  ORF Transcript_20441/g.66861 Transcript_20441/m.66861 type:complete len:120 (+) Transcript_20441:223-582(+)
MSASGAGEWPSDVQLLLGQLSDDPAGTMHDLLDTSAFASDATESERLGARQHIIARLADIMEHVSSYDRKDRAAAQRLVDALWHGSSSSSVPLDRKGSLSALDHRILTDSSILSRRPKF